MIIDAVAFVVGAALLEENLVGALIDSQAAGLEASLFGADMLRWSL